ncbi:hypothetical protein JRO89_XS14G0069400 [Xanthoceras sorbifolium]|uniref:Uncharacterized protein n=1 Tax=Xanthoceras sorbifolium TaxID=99658 RepID=A0ABQ8H463_9ROSI|nr:hypothetical protein JRO89_XS14G0069400 [Xanthoceras sorbifolium]
MEGFLLYSPTVDIMCLVHTISGTELQSLSLQEEGEMQQVLHHPSTYHIISMHSHIYTPKPPANPFQQASSFGIINIQQFNLLGTEMKLLPVAFPDSFSVTSKVIN